MIVILKRVGEAARVPDIKHFLNPALQGGIFKKAGKIGSVKIQMHRQKTSRKVEYHALVSIDPDVVGQRVVKLLNRKLFKGKPINVTEYSLRHFSNDRRQSRYQSLNNRRLTDRRRKHMHIADVTDESKRIPKTEPVADINWY